MIDDTDDSLPKDPSDPSSGNLSPHHQSLPETESDAPHQHSTSMEVHHHAHHGGKRKRTI